MRRPLRSWLTERPDEETIDILNDDIAVWTLHKFPDIDRAKEVLKYQDYSTWLAHMMNKEYHTSGRLDITLDTNYSIQQISNIQNIYEATGIDYRKIQENVVDDTVDTFLTMYKVISELTPEERQYYREISNQFRKEREQEKELVV